MNLQEIPEKFQKFGDLLPAGVGTQGKVYRFQGNDRVVLKVIECTEEIQYQSVLREMEIMDCLADCDRVLHLLDREVVEESGSRVVYFLLESARRLEDSIFLTAMSAKKAVHLCIQLCDALIECRCRGVMHLDIKPQNLFLDLQGDLRLGDFGVSLYERELQENQLLRGSLNYMAPEVYRNRTNSEQSEIYSVGLVLYWLLNNYKLPFEWELFGNKEAILYKRLAGTAFPEISFEDKVVDETLASLFRTVCAFEPDNRPQSFEELRELLCRLQEIVPDKSTTMHSLLGSMPIPFPKPQASGTAVIGQAPLFGKNADAPYIPGVMQDADEFSTTVPLVAQMSQDDTAPLAPVPQMSKVQFSAVAPKVFTKGDYAMVEIVMYEEQYRFVVDELLANMDQPAQENKSGMISVAEHSRVRIVLTSPDVEIEDNVEEREWNGGYLDFSFAVLLPEQYKKRQMLFLATVYINDLPVTKLKFIVQCRSLREQRLEVTRQDVLSAFISYASQDRAKVVTLIQGMKKILPDIDLFFDVESLRSGENWELALRREIENRDILFLCWSRFAKESKWVDAEWRYALENKGVDCIEPIPMELPGVCPPPKELEQKHFSDKLLYLVNQN